MYDSSSYLTADPATLRAAAEKAAEASKALNAGDEEDDEDEDDDMEGSDDDDEEEDEDEEDDEPKAGPSRLPAGPKPTTSSSGIPEESDTPAVDPSTIPTQPQLPPGPPPRIMITTSPSPCKDTYAFCDDLKGIFPGGEFFKRPKGKGFEIGRVARWAAKRGFNAVCVVNEDHKIAS